MRVADGPNSLLQRGAEAFLAGDNRRGLKNWEAALSSLTGKANQSHRLEVLRRLSFAYRRAGHPARARELLEIQCSEAADLSNLHELALGHYSLGLLCSAIGDEVAAEQNWRMAADTARCSNLSGVLADALACIASLRSSAGLYRDAEPLLEEARHAAEAGGTTVQLADVLDDLARLHLSTGREESAVVLARNAADAYRRSGDEEAAVRVARDFLQLS